MVLNMKLINTNNLPKKLAINTIRVFTKNNPSEVAINRKDCYLACWSSSNQEMWLEILSRSGQTGVNWSVTIASTRKSVDSVLRSYFYSNNPVKHFRDTIDLYILVTGFTF